MRKQALPILAVVLALAGLSASIYNYHTLRSSGVHFVTLDMSRVINAERASVAGILKGQAPAISPNAFGQQLKGAIGQAAGPNTVVLIRQAVALPRQSGLPDITDQVIHDLGLPNVAASSATPTQAAELGLGDTAYAGSKSFKNLSQRQAEAAKNILEQAKKAALNVAP